MFSVKLCDVNDAICRRSTVEQSLWKSRNVDKIHELDSLSLRTFEFTNPCFHNISKISFIIPAVNLAFCLTTIRNFCIKCIVCTLESFIIVLDRLKKYIRFHDFKRRKKFTYSSDVLSSIIMILNALLLQRIVCSLSKILTEKSIRKEPLNNVLKRLSRKRFGCSLVCPRTIEMNTLLSMMYFVT